MKLLAVGLLFLVVILSSAVSMQLSHDQMAVVVGMVVGMGLAIPVVALILVLWERNQEEKCEACQHAREEAGQRQPMKPSNVPQVYSSPGPQVWIDKAVMIGGGSGYAQATDDDLRYLSRR